MTSADFVRRVLVVDDENIIRYLLVNLLEKLGFEAWSAGSAVECMQLIRKVDPDVVVLDLDLGHGASGADLVSAIRLQNSSRGIVMLSNFLPKKTEQLSLDRVVYLHKSELQDEQTIESAIDKSVGLAKPEAPLAIFEFAEDIQSLTRNQQEILELLSQGMTNGEMAVHLGTGIRAVERTVTRIYVKLGLSAKPVGSRRVEAARRFIMTLGSARSGS